MSRFFNFLGILIHALLECGLKFVFHGNSSLYLIVDIDGKYSAVVSGLNTAAMIICPNAPLALTSYMVLHPFGGIFEHHYIAVIHRSAKSEATINRRTRLDPAGIARLRAEADAALASIRD